MRIRLIIALIDLQLQNYLAEIVSAQDTQVECCGHLANPWQSTEIVGDLNTILPVDLFIPGCPPHPLTTLHALMNFFKQKVDGCVYFRRKGVHHKLSLRRLAKGGPVVCLISLFKCRGVYCGNNHHLKRII